MRKLMGIVALYGVLALQSYQALGDASENASNQSGVNLLRSDSWQPGTSSRVDSGRLRLEGPGAKLEQRGVAVKAGETYKLSYRVKGEGDAKTVSGYHVFRVYAKLSGAWHTFEGNWQDCIGNAYQEKEMTFTIPEDAVKGEAQVSINCEQQSSGIMSIDKFKLENVMPEKAAPYELEITSPYYHNDIYSSDPVAAIAGVIRPGAAVAKITTALSGQGKELFHQEYNADTGRIEFSVPAKELPVGEYRLAVSAFSSDGKELSSRSVAIRKLASASNEVIIKKDNKIYVNGKVFFPIVCEVTLGDKSDLALYNASRCGINTIEYNDGGGVTPAEMKRLLDRAQTYGLKVIPYFSPAKGGYDKWLAGVEAMLAPEIMRHPALLCYSLFDEPLWNGVPLAKVKSVYELFARRDPYHPLRQTEAPRGSLAKVAEYGKYCDIYGVDVYPVPATSKHSGLEDKGVTSIGAYVQRMRESVNDRKPINIWLQAFSWDILNHKAEGVYPTPQEMRFMSYDATMHGTAMISYWGVQAIDRISFYKELYQVTGEMSRMSGVFCAGEDIFPVSAASPLNIVAKRYDGKNYLIVANRSDKMVDGAMAAPLPDAMLTVLGENRAVALKNGKLSDRFTPYAVHVYSDGAAWPAPLWPLTPLDGKFEKVAHLYLERITNLTWSHYPGDAYWIWYPGDDKKDGAKMWVVKKFEVKDNLKTGRLFVAADDKHRSYLNGELISESDSFGWSHLQDNDITKKLKTGKNLLAIEVEDAGHVPCGLLADVWLGYPDGKLERVISDRTWKTTNQKPSATWNVSPDTTNWRDAAELFPFGKGPWGGGR